MSAERDVQAAGAAAAPAPGLRAAVPVMLLPPPVVAPERVDDALRFQGHAVVDGAGLGRWLGRPADALRRWQPFWERLPPDPHLRDGGRYRRRRHASFVIDGGQVLPQPHRPHWQPVEYNALHGGFERWFEPVEPALVDDALWERLLVVLAERADALRGMGEPWFVETHPFRIDTTDGIGRPTPEGAHRDGVDLVAVLLLGRHAVRGGETRVFDAAGPTGLRFTMIEHGTMLLLDDERVIHESTPIQPVDAVAPGWRDTLVVTLRRRGFQGPGA